MTEHIEQARWEAFLNDFSKTHHGLEARGSVAEKVVRLAPCPVLVVRQPTGVPIP